MTLEDFEKELAKQRREEKDAAGQEKRSHRSRDRHRHHRQHGHTDEDRDHGRHKQRSRRDQSDEEHQRKRRRRSKDADEGRDRWHRDRSHDGNEDREHRRHRSRSRDQHHSMRKQQTSRSRSPGASKDGLNTTKEPALRRDAWMESPAAMEVTVKHRRTSSEVQPVTADSIRADHELKIHANELNKHHLQDLKERSDEPEEEAALDKPVQHEVNYTFGDEGSEWRLTRLKNVYRQAKESGQGIEEVALRQYGDLRLFDDAREEETEMDRRATYGKDYVGKEKPSGELFQERKLNAGFRRKSHPAKSPPEAELRMVNEAEAAEQTIIVDQSYLNKLKADMMKAKLRKAPNAAQLETEYERKAAAFASNNHPEVVVISKMDNRLLTGGRRGEVNQISTKRGRERGQVEENEDMSIDDMVRAERRTKGQAGGEGKLLAERIAKDGKFDNDLEYLDENAAKLAKRIQKSEVSLRNATVASLRKTNRILDQCQLCHHEERTNPLPTAPVISRGTRTYLSLPAEPETKAEPEVKITSEGAVIVPLEHRKNLLECDDDEWEELRNFMKSLTRMYAADHRSVLFYENAAHPHRQEHATLVAVPLTAADKDDACGLFRNAILQTAPEWSQHRKIIDTAAAAKKGMGRMAFRRSLVKEMPYFHVWFSVDGGLGHVVEDGSKWPRGDLFAREILGDLLHWDIERVRARGKWLGGDNQNKRVNRFRERWGAYDWTKMLVEGG